MKGQTDAVTTWQGESRGLLVGPCAGLAVRERTPAAGFTLTDLLVAVGLTGVVWLLMSSALAGSGVNGQRLVCLNNEHRLVTAWRMYATDNNDELPFACALNTANLTSAWVPGTSETYDPPPPPDWDYEASIRQGALWRYCGNAISIFHCPSDPSIVTNLRGRKFLRRSVSMNNWVGGNADSPANGYKGYWGLASPAKVYRKLSQLRKPPPATTFVFLDERPESLNDGCFVTEMEGYPNRGYTKIVDYPGIFHSTGAGFGFADGHAEIHRWADQRTAPPPGSSLQFNIATPNNPDVFWLQSHAAGLP